jgi:hypothetical protein
MMGQDSEELQVQPKLDVASFSTHFYGEKEHGWDTVLARLKNGKHACEEVALLWRERASIEEEYSKVCFHNVNRPLENDQTLSSIFHS